MIRGNMPSPSEWRQMILKYQKKYQNLEKRMLRRHEKGRISKEKMDMKLKAFRLKKDPISCYRFTTLEANEFYGLNPDTTYPKIEFTSVTGNNIYNFKMVIKNIINNNFKRTRVGSKDDHKNASIYEKFMSRFTRPTFPTEYDGLYFHTNDEKFGMRDRLDHVPTAIYDAINSDLHFTPYSLNVSKEESNLMLTDMIRFYNIYDDGESGNWFNMTDLDIYSIGNISGFDGVQIRYDEDHRYLNTDSNRLFEEVLFHIASIIGEDFKNVDPLMDALGIKFVGIMVTPYPLSIQHGIDYINSTMNIAIHHRIYNFYLIINQKY